MKKLILALTAVFILGIGGQWIYGNRSTPNRNEKTVEALRVVEKPVQAFDVKPYPVTEVPKPVEAKQVIVTSPSKK